MAASAILGRPVNSSEAFAIDVARRRL